MAQDTDVKENPIDIKSVEIEILQDAKDFLRFYISYYLTFNNFFVFFLSFAIFGILTSFLLKKEIAGFQFLEILVAACVYVFLFLLILIYVSLENAKKKGVGRYKYIFTDEGVTIIAESFESNLDWTNFVSARETSNYFFLYPKSGQTNFIPKKFFSNYEQLTDFKDLVSAKLDGKAQFKKSNLGLK